PSRSMWMIMYLSVSSTLVTVCAFNLSCFLRNVSMSTSILFLSVAVHHSPQKIRCIGDSDQPLHRQPAASKTLRLQLHFRDGNPYWTQVSEVMPGYHSTQQTFTAYFTDALDVIDRTESCPCYHRWLEL